MPVRAVVDAGEDAITGLGSGRRCGGVEAPTAAAASAEAVRRLFSVLPQADVGAVLVRSEAQLDRLLSTPAA